MKAINNEASDDVLANAILGCTHLAAAAADDDVEKQCLNDVSSYFLMWKYLFVWDLHMHLWQ